MFQTCFPVNIKVQTMFTFLLISDKNTSELEINVISTSKKLKFLRFLTYVWTKKTAKNGRKTIYHEPVHVG